MDTLQRIQTILNTQETNSIELLEILDNQYGIMYMINKGLKYQVQIWNKKTGWINFMDHNRDRCILNCIAEFFNVINEIENLGD